MTPSDEIMLNRWTINRDSEAFRAIVDRYAGMIFATSQRILKNPADAEDNTQECFEVLAETTQIPKECILGPWLHRVATNRALNRIRTDTRRKNREVCYADEFSSTTEIHWNDVYDFVDEAIEALPKDLRDPVVSHFICGQSHRQISRLTGIPSRTVSNRIRLGLESIGKKLQGKGIVIPATALSSLLVVNMAKASTMPHSLSVLLGKLVIYCSASNAHKTSSASGTAVALGGVIAMKKLAVVIVILAAVIVGMLLLSREKSTAIIEQQNTPALAESMKNTTPTNPLAAKSQTPEEAIVFTPKSESGQITVRVRDSDTAEPVSDVEIHVSSIVEDEGKKQDIHFAITTGSNGEYQVNDVKPGKYTFNEPIRFGRSYGNLEKSIQVKSGQSVVCDLFVSLGLTIRGHVVNEQGNPLGNVRISAMTNQENTWRETQSEEDGTFTVPGFGLPGTGFIILASKKGYAMSALKSVTVPEGGLRDLVLTMYPEATISGVVTDEKGKTVEDIGVCATTDKEFIGSKTTRTSTDGSFKLDRLGEGQYSIVLCPPGSRLWSFENEVMQIDITHREHIEKLVLVWTNPGDLMISGRVTKRSGDPVSLASITVDGPVCNSLQTERDGTYHFSNLPEGRYKISARNDFAEGGQTYVKEDVAAGSDRIDFIFEECATIKGKVIDVENKPVSAFDVAFSEGIKDTIDGNIMSRYRPMNNPKGEFILSNIPQGDATLFVRAVGYSQQIQPIHNVQSGETANNIIVKLEQGNVIDGTVQNINDEPLPETRIYLGMLPEQEMRTHTAITTTDKQGRFRVNVMPSKTQVLSAFHTAYAPNSIEIAANVSKVHNVKIVLTPGGIIEGKVTLDGIPVTDKHVFLLYDEGAVNERTVTDKDGGFRFEHVMPRLTRIHADVGPLTGLVRRSNSITREILPREGLVTNLNLNAVSGDGVIEGIATVNGKPSDRPVYFETQLASGEKMEFVVVPAKNGSYRVEGIPAGKVVVQDRLWNPSLNNMDIENFAFLNLSSGQILRQDISLRP